MKVVLYTLPTCIKCRMLKETFKQRGVEFEEVGDIEVMASKGIQSVPVVELEDGTRLQFEQASKLGQ